MSKFVKALEQAEHERVSANRTPRGVLAETLSQMDARGRWGAQEAPS
jgi:hypothetical protein